MSDSSPSLVVAPLDALLPEIQEALEEARLPNGWDAQRLRQIIRHEFGFLGPFTEARIEKATSANGGEVLVLEFTPPPGRDLASAERRFEKATRRAERGDVRTAQAELRRLVQEFPEVPKYRRALGQTHLVLGEQAARLMLAVIERMVTEAGGTYLFTDTDSMAIVASQRGGHVACLGGPDRLRDGRPAVRALTWAAVDRIISRLEKLKPYGPTVRDPLLKLEDENWYEGKRVQLYGYMLSAKRYCLFCLDEHGRVIIRKPSEHVLGTYMSPEDPPEDDAEEDEDEPEEDPDEGWIADTWRDHVHRALGRPGRRLPGWMARPAMHRESFTSPASLRPFLSKSEQLSYADQLKPFNFALRAQIAPGGEAIGIEPGRSRLLAPFERDPRKWLNLDWHDEYSKTPTRITTGERLHPSMSTVQSMRDVVVEYGEHPETKSLGPDGETCHKATAGLLTRRHVFPSWIQHIGKEANRLEDVERGDVQEWDEVLERFERLGKGEWEVEVLPALSALGAERVAAASGLSPRQVYRILKSGRRPPLRTARILTRVYLATKALQWL